ncbi:MAG: Smr/MutS family protein [Bacteroidota bacterium]
MQKLFKIGDKIEWIDDLMTGQITAINDDKTLHIETDEGFVVQANPSEVIKIPNNDTISVDFDELEKQRQIDEELMRKKKSVKRPKDRKQPPLEVDLHIHELVENTRGLSNFDMLNRQLDTARHKLEFAIKKRIKRVVFIHGVGEGVLKAELETMLRRYDNVDFYAASFKEYGYGATEVYIYENY